LIEHAYKAKYVFDDLVGDSPAIRKVAQFAGKVALGETDILINGESGTGKELVARAIHENSSRAKMPFIAINSGGIPEIFWKVKRSLRGKRT